MLGTEVSPYSPLPLPSDSVESAILTRVHHELKTPLFSILTAVEILRETSHPSRHWVLEVLQNNAAHLRSLVDDLLLYADLVHGRASLHPEPVDLQAVLAEQTGARAEAARARGVGFETFAVGPIPLALADARLARVIVGHLVDNAVKFNREGGRVEASWSDLGGWVELRLANTGEEIPASEREFIFRPFTQLEDPMTRRHNGIGLGLAIVRTALETLGGSVGVTSLPDGRNLFSIRLPKA